MAIVTNNQTHPVIVGNTTYEHGFTHGLSWYFSGDHPDQPPTWHEIVDFIRDNMLELDREGFLDEERLIDNTGFLVGWILGQYTQR